MKYNRIMPRDDDSFYLWYDSMKGFRLNIIGDGNCNFNREADVLFQIERERIIKLAKQLEAHSTHSELCYKEHRFVERLLDAIKGENK